MLRPAPPTLPPTDGQLTSAIFSMRTRHNDNMVSSLAAVSAAAVSAAVTAAMTLPAKAKPKTRVHQETEHPMMRES